MLYGMRKIGKVGTFWIMLQSFTLKALCDLLNNNTNDNNKNNDDDDGDDDGDGDDDDDHDKFIFGNDCSIELMNTSAILQLYALQHMTKFWMDCDESLCRGPG